MTKTTNNKPAVDLTAEYSKTNTPCNPHEQDKVNLECQHPQQPLRKMSEPCAPEGMN